MTAQLEVLLWPLVLQEKTEHVYALEHIITVAADLSRQIRMMHNVVYYWPPTFKDEEFEPGRMEGLNIRNMIDTSPYEKRDVQGRVRANLLPDQDDRNEAIVRVVCFPGLVAYRKGGGALGKQELADEDRQERRSRDPEDVRHHRERVRAHDGISVDSGFRSKVICKAIVHLQWGKQRLLTKEAGTSAHLDATRDYSDKYEKSRKGFRELFDIYLERQAQSAAQRAADGR